MKDFDFDKNNNKHVRNAIIAGAIAALVLLAFCSRAEAAEGQATMVASGSGICKGPFERFEDQLRQRPLAVVNESTRPAYINCWFPVLKEAATQYGGVEYVSMYLRNQGTSQQNVQCTLVTGNDATGPTFNTKNTSLPGGLRKEVRWDGPATGFVGPLQVQCILPTQVGIGETEVHWDYNDAT